MLSPPWWHHPTSLVLVQHLPSATWKKKAFEMSSFVILKITSSNFFNSSTWTLIKSTGPLRSLLLHPMRCSPISQCLIPDSKTSPDLLFLLRAPHHLHAHPVQVQGFHPTAWSELKLNHLSFATRLPLLPQYTASALLSRRLMLH